VCGAKECEMYAAYAFLKPYLSKAFCFYNVNIMARVKLPSPAGLENNMSSKTFFDCHM